MIRMISLLAAVALVSGAGSAQIGEALDKPGLVDFTQTDARSWKDLATGRLVLLEFFAHW